MTDIILRDCGSVGWLALIIEEGAEVYRTGIHYPTATEALEKAEFMLIRRGYIIPPQR